MNKTPNFSLVTLGFQLLGILIAGIALFLLKHAGLHDSYLVPVFAVATGIAMGMSWANNWRYRKLKQETEQDWDESGDE